MKGENLHYRYSTLERSNDELPREEFLRIMRTDDASEKFELYKDGTCILKDNGDDGYHCLFALEMGYMNIEAQMYAAYEKDTGTIRPSVEYFCCKKYGEGDDEWESDDFICSVMNDEEVKCVVNFADADWDRQMEKDMKAKLEMYCERKGYDYTKPVK